MIILIQKNHYKIKFTGKFKNIPVPKTKTNAKIEFSNFF